MNTVNSFEEIIEAHVQKKMSILCNEQTDLCVKC